MRVALFLTFNFFVMKYFNPFLFFIASMFFVNHTFGQLNLTSEEVPSQSQELEQSILTNSSGNSFFGISEESAQSATSLATVIQVGQGNVSELSLQQGSAIGVNQYGFENEVNIQTNGNQMNLNVEQIGAQNYFESQGGNQLMNGAKIQQNGNNLQMRMYHNQ